MIETYFIAHVQVPQCARYCCRASMLPDSFQVWSDYAFLWLAHHQFLQVRPQMIQMHSLVVDILKAVLCENENPNLLPILK